MQEMTNTARKLAVAGGCCSVEPAVLRLVAVCRLGSEEQVELERRTRGQGRNCDWARERRERLTASNFGRSDDQC